MGMSDPKTITVLLDRMRSGDGAAVDELIPLVYPELRHMAASYLRTERKEHTLQPTALVHEAYLRLMGSSALPDFQSRAHFFGVASQVMRQILVDAARRVKSAKRTIPGTRVEIIEALDAAELDLDLVTRVDDALEALAKKDKTLAKLVEMRFFGGLTGEESAEVLHMPVREVRKQLRVAQAWLQRELDGHQPPA